MPEVFSQSGNYKLTIPTVVVPPDTARSGRGEAVNGSSIEKPVLHPDWGYIFRQ